MGPQGGIVCPKSEENTDCPDLWWVVLHSSLFHILTQPYNAMLRPQDGSVCPSSEETTDCPSLWWVVYTILGQTELTIVELRIVLIV